MTNFENLGLLPILQKDLQKARIITPTPIQARSIPLLLEGHDLLGIAQTGTGKTAAYALPLIQKILNSKTSDKKRARALVVAPTRELCQQISEALTVFSSSSDLKILTITGGGDQEGQIESLRTGVDIIVGTPGRLLDLYSQKQLPLGSIEGFVLDEADRMLDMGFLDEIMEILGLLPERRQSMLFSATMPVAVEKLALRILSRPQRVEINPVHSSPDKISQRIIFCKRDHKFQLLKQLLKEDHRELTLVFTRTKENADSVVEYLAQNRIASRALHGDKKQTERDRALNHFKDQVIKVLVATDIASRGIDIDGVSHVINFDFPIDSETYIHRIGRTARAGRDGEAITFCEASEKPKLLKLEEHLQTKLPTESFEGKFEPLRIKKGLAQKTKQPTPGKSQERTAYLDHSKRQKPLLPGEKREHPGFRKPKKRRK